MPNLIEDKRKLFSCYPFIPFPDVFQTARSVFSKACDFCPFSAHCIPSSPFALLQPCFKLTLPADPHPRWPSFVFVQCSAAPEAEPSQPAFPLPGMLSPNLFTGHILLTLQVQIYMLIFSGKFSLTPEAEAQLLNSFSGL